MIYPVPTGFYVNQIQARSAQLNWNSVSGPGYIVSFGLATQNPNSWAQFMVCNGTPMAPASYMVAMNLQPNSLYRARIRTNCTNCTSAIQVTDRRSNWSNTIEWRTPNAREELSAGDFNQAVTLNVYPNPNKGQFELSASFGDNEESGEVEIMDLTGKVLYRKVFFFDESNTTFPIDLSDASSGIYLLRYQSQTSGTVRRFKVIIE